MNISITKNNKRSGFFMLFGVFTLNFIIMPTNGYCEGNVAVRRGSKIVIDFILDNKADRWYNYGNGNREDEYLVGDWIGY